MSLGLVARTTARLQRRLPVRMETAVATETETEHTAPHTVTELLVFREPGPVLWALVESDEPVK